MKPEEDILKQFISVAKSDKNIRAVYLEGSRARETRRIDELQDYDVVFVVEDVSPYLGSERFIQQFGNVAYKQEPDRRSDGSLLFEDSYAWLCQMDHGIRMDIHVSTWKHAQTRLESYRVLFDKDHLFQEKEVVDESMHWIEKPTQEAFHESCNEFWWLTNNLTKALWRNSALEVFDCLQYHLYPELVKQLAWRVSEDYHYKINLGKSYYRLETLLDPEDYQSLLSFRRLDQDITAIEAGLIFFSRVAQSLAKQCHFEYNKEEERAAMHHFRSVLQSKPS